MIDLIVNEEQLERAIQRARERKIIIPTFEQQKNPDSIPEKVKNELKGIELWDINLKKSISGLNNSMNAAVCWANLKRGENLPTYVQR